MSSFQIKIIALILMTIDHVGEFLFPQCDLLGYIGRLSAPLFLYILCWSIDYTRSRKKFLIRTYAASVLMDVIWIILGKAGIYAETYNNVFSTFFVVIAVIMLLENKSLNKIAKVCIILGWQIAVFLLYFMIIDPLLINAKPQTLMLILHSLGVVSYSEGGWFWLVLGVVIYYCKNENRKLIIGYTGICLFRAICVMMAVFPRMLYFIQWHIGGIVSDVANMIFAFFYGNSYAMAPIELHGLYLGDYQWIMIFALPIMLLYNNQKGKNFKYFFYIYYAAHVVVLCVLSNLLYLHN